MDKYKLVPVEPTPEMASEGARFLQIMSLPEREAVSVFRAMLAAAPTIQGEPVAWMHSDPGRVDVIHDKVRKLLKDSSDNAGYLHRPLDKSERYTIPLYTAPTREEQKEPDSLCVEDDGCPTEKAVLQRFWRKHHQTAPDMPVLTEALQAELETVKKVAYGNNELLERNEALQAECEELRKDADRYRWLRDPCSGAERVVTYGRGDYGRGLMSYTMLDGAIDSAMHKAQKKDNEE